MEIPHSRQGSLVQERFAEGNPLGLRTNAQIGFVWYSVLASTIGSGIGPNDGWFNATDKLYYPWPSGDTSNKTTTHEYWGGTTSTSEGGPGIHLNPFTHQITFTYGTPGTASQHRENAPVITVISAIALTALTAQQPPVQFPFQDSRLVAFTNENVYGALSIVTEIGRAASIERAAINQTIPAPFDVDHVRVVASNRYDSGADLAVLTVKMQPGLKVVQPPIGTRILLLCSGAEGKVLDMPGGIGEGGETHLPFPAISDNEVLGLAFFETTATRLPVVFDHEWQFLQALAEAIPQTSDENVEKIERYIEMIRPPGMDDIALTQPKSHDKYSDLFASAVKNESPYHCALIYYALNRYSYIGFSDLYYRAVFESAGDRHAFPHGVPPVWYWEDPARDATLPKDYTHTSYDKTLWDRAILNSQNPRVYDFLLQKYPFTPDAAMEQRIASLLDDPNPLIRHRTASRIAAWHNDMQHAPKPYYQERDSHGKFVQVVYPDLDAAVSYWKAKIRKK